MFALNCVFRNIAQIFFQHNVLNAKLIVIKELNQDVFWLLTKNKQLISTKFILIFKKEKIDYNARDAIQKLFIIVKMNATLRISIALKPVIIKLT